MGNHNMATPYQILSCEKNSTIQKIHNFFMKVKEYLNYDVGMDIILL